MKTDSLPYTMPDHSRIPVPSDHTQAIIALAFASAANNNFRHGKILVTPGVQEVCSPGWVWHCIARHVAGDWGVLEEEDIQANHAAMATGDRIFSVYVSDSGDKVYVITEADRSATTVLLPEEY